MTEDGRQKNRKALSSVCLPSSVEGTFCCFRRLNLCEVPAAAIERRMQGGTKTMSIKRILLPLPGAVDHVAQMDMALSASKALGAHVEALFISEPPPRTTRVTEIYADRLAVAQ